MSRLMVTLRGFGPAILVAAVVCGPGSMLMSSKAGALHGYTMIWLVVLAAVFMWGMIVLAARVGVVYARTPLGEVACRLGRPVAVAVGLCLFLVVVGFQVSNNLAVIAALEPFGLHGGPQASPAARMAVLLGLNALVLAALYRFKSLYPKVERLLKTVVLLIVVSFAINLVVARPDLRAMLAGLVPTPPPGGYRALLQPGGGPAITVLQALVATTFSVAGAFYQAYAVRARGFGLTDVRRGMHDSLVGTGVLAGVSIILMATAAAGRDRGTVDPESLATVADVSRQFEPLFGTAATYLFATGILAGGLGAFLVNALIGGHVFADALALGTTMDDRGARHATAAALVLAATVAMTCLARDVRPVAAITIAQASTVLGLPALALTLIYLGTRPELTGPRRIPRWMIGLAFGGLVLAILLAFRTAGVLAGRGLEPISGAGQRTGSERRPGRPK
jgi:manganese transport protein